MTKPTNRNSHAIIQAPREDPKWSRYFRRTKEKENQTVHATYYRSRLVHDGLGNLLNGLHC